MCILGLTPDRLLFCNFDGELIGSEGDLDCIKLPLWIADGFCLYRQTGYHRRNIHVGLARKQKAMFLALDLSVVSDIDSNELTGFLVFDPNHVAISRENHTSNFDLLVEG